jgi:hypothetical protein
MSHAYDRTHLKCRIAHFGVGNFHRAHQAFYILDVSKPRLDSAARRLLISGDPYEALRVEPLLASCAAEHADFVACFDHYRKALAERGANAMLKAVLDATEG